MKSRPIILMLFALSGCSQATCDITLAWKASTSPNVRYNVYIRTVDHQGKFAYHKRNKAPLTETSFSDNPVKSDPPVTYVVRSLDNSGQESADSEPIMVPPFCPEARPRKQAR